jgi:MFS family permease
MNSGISRKQAYMFAFAALLLVSFTAATSYLAYDIIAPIADKLEMPTAEGGMGLSSTRVNFLYSVYSIPVIIFVVFGGLLADKLGARRSGILFAAVFALGTVLTAMQPSSYLTWVNDYYVMLSGRVLLGIGAECFYVVMNKILAKWFKDKILATAFGINLFLCRAGSYLALAFGAWLMDMLGSWTLTLWVTAAVSVFSVLAMVAYFFLDRYGERTSMTAIVEEVEGEFKIGEALRLPLAFWVISGLCMVYYSAVFPFIAIAPRFFIEHKGMTGVDAGRSTGVIILLSMFTTWIFGLLVDKFGKRATLMIIGSLVMIPCHASLVLTDITPWIPMVVLGVSFSLVPAALWPALPLMVKDEHIGTAYGVIAMVQNIGLFAFPLLAGLLRDSSGNYYSSMLMFTGLAVAGLFLAIWLKAIELKQGSYLDRKPA